MRYSETSPSIVMRAFWWFILPWRLHANLDEFLNKLVVRVKAQDYQIKELSDQIHAHNAVINDFRAKQSYQAQKSPH